MAYLSFLCENLEGDTNALQAFLGNPNDHPLSYFLLSFNRLSFLSPSENTLLSMSDVAHAIRTLPERRLLDGYRLVSKIESTRDKLLLGFHQVCVCVCACVRVRACVCVWVYVCVCILNKVHFFDVQQFKLGEAPSLKTVSEVVESAKDSDGSR